MADSKLQSLKAYLDEAADSYLAGQGDELSALAESVVPEGGLIDRPGFGERFGRNLDRRRDARKTLQDEQMLAGGLGGLTGTVLSPMSRVLSFPARVATSAVEEIGRSDPKSGLEYLKALAVGAGQGALQHVAPGIVAEAKRLRSRSSAAYFPRLLDLTQSNVSPGFQRQLEVEQRQREEQERKKAKE